MVSWSQHHHKIASQRPKPFLGGSDEAIEGAGFADDGSHLGGGLGQHADFILAKNAGCDGLNHQHSLQDAAIDQGNSQKGLVSRLRRLH